MTHVMKGMQYLHSIGIYHQHLKPENLYITASGLVKMGGFDLKNHDEDDREKNFYFSPDYYFEKR
jgi:serine/threonine protein kinase